MSSLLEPRLDVLPPPQRRLWQELQGIPPAFALYDGTAIALHLGHRKSVDFDFFAFESFDPGILLENIAFLGTSTILQSAASTLTLLVDRDGPFQLSFFGDGNLGSVPADTQKRLRAAVTEVDLDTLPTLDALRPHRDHVS